MKAVAYVRVSTEEQATEGVSLDAQEATLRNYCAMRGLELAEVVVDAGVSAGKHLDTRDGGARLLSLVQRGKVQAVVTYKLDRLFRDASDCLAVTAQWDKAGVALHLVDLGGQSVDTSSAMGRFFLTIMAGAAEMERNLIRERTSAAMQHKASKREYTGGHAPYGWTVGPDGTHLVADEAEQRIIAAARTLREQGLSLRKVGAALTADGILPRSGGQWNPKTVRDLLEATAA